MLRNLGLRRKFNFMNSRIAVLLAGMALVVPIRMASSQRTIDEFNTAFSDATRRMSSAASLALWADDGVSIQPSMRTINGKKNIGAYFDTVMKSIAAARMQSFQMRCFDIRTSGDLATEWCIEHQVVLLADLTTFDGWGKMALVLRREADGTWRMIQETWLPSEPEPDLLPATKP